MYVRCLDTNTIFQTDIEKDSSHMDLYQHTRFRPHVDSYKMIHSPHGHSVIVPFQLHYYSIHLNRLTVEAVDAFFGHN